MERAVDPGRDGLSSRRAKLGGIDGRELDGEMALDITKQIVMQWAYPQPSLLAAFCVRDRLCSCRKGVHVIILKAVCFE